MRATYFFYIAKIYSKNLIIILLGITLAITLIDYLQNSSKITDSSNQIILYLFYTWEFRLSQFYPLAMVFSAVITYMSLVQSNVLVSLLSFGYSRKQLFIPFVLPSIALYLLLIFLQMGEFAYAKEKAWSILHHAQSARKKDDLFFKYNDSFVYVKTLDPIEQVLKDVTVFEVKNKTVQSTITLDLAKFDGTYWVTDHAILTQKQYSKQGVLEGFKKENRGRYKLLKGYKPKVIELIYEGDSLSLIDAVNTYKVLEKQGLDSSKIKASFYNKVILPLFSLAIITMLFFKTSFYARYMNRELVWIVSLGGTLAVWGLLYALYSLSSGGSISPELAVVLPVVLLLAYAVYLYKGGKEKLA
jgi:lipopolysaccharide export system permease protein